MARTDNDTWDLASSVGATATAVAASRAMASQNPDALLNDPWADPLVRAVGIDTFVKLIDGETGHTDDPLLNRRAMNEQITVRTRFFDDFFVQASESGIRQAVILASGLDTRAYRLPWPADTTVFEIDQPQVIAFKTRTLADLGAEPTAERTTVAIDLREDWPAALVEAGFDPKLPTAWSASAVRQHRGPVRTGQPHRHRTHGPAQYSGGLGRPAHRAITSHRLRHQPGRAVLQRGPQSCRRLSQRPRLAHRHPDNRTDLRGQRIRATRRRAGFLRRWVWLPDGDAGVGASTANVQ
jgi:hypothetical protein